MTDIRTACLEQSRRAAIALYDRFTHEGMDRRVFMTELTRIAGGTAAASALLAGIAASPAAAAITEPTDPRLIARRETWTLPDGRKMSGYAAALRQAPARRASVMIIHENRGLNPHTEDVTRRMALAGYHAVAPDFLSALGGTPADEDAARTLIGTLDLAQATADGVATLTKLKGRRTGNGKAGAVGFCWGGAMVNRLAVDAGTALDAGVPYYGTAPAPAEAASVRAPLLIHLASLDARVNGTALPWGEALTAAGKDVRVINHQGVNHAFNNDTSAERYDKTASDTAWGQTLAFFTQHLRA